jgi:hypothetical protein
MSEGKAGIPDIEQMMIANTLPLQINKRLRNSKIGRDRQISQYELRHQADVASIEQAKIELAAVLQQRAEAEDQAHVAHLEGELAKMVKEQLICEKHCRVLERKNGRLKAKIREQQITLQATLVEMYCRRAFGHAWIASDARRLVMQEENVTHLPEC